MKFSGKKILILIDRFGLGALFAMVSVAFIAAVIEAIPSGSSGLKAYGSAIIDTFTSDAKDSTGAAKIMHVLLTVALGWAVIKVYMATAGYRWDSFIARFFIKNHVVIMAGQSGDSKSDESQLNHSKSKEGLANHTVLAIDIALELAQKHKVVLNIPDIHSSRLPKLWSAGVRVIKDDLDLPDLLEATGIKRAKTLIAMRNSYTENITLIRAALADSIGNSTLECKCMIEPINAKQGFKLEDYLEDDSLARVRVFNESELIARRILRDNPPDTLVAQTNQGVHVLLIGFGSVGMSIAVQLARQGHYRSGKKPKITIVDKQVEFRWQQIVKMYSTLPDWLVVERMESRIEDVQEEHAEKWLKDDCPITTVYVCTKNELANLRIARLLLRLLDKDNNEQSSNVQVVTLDPPGGCVLNEFSKRADNKNRFKLFSLVRSKNQGEGCSIDTNLMTETDDVSAIALHEDYCKTEDERLEKSSNKARKPAHKPWDQLAETYREANRSTADHIDVKLRAVGRTLASSLESVESPLTKDEIELLAQMEHQRWWAERSLDGWKYGPVRNDVQKLHPNMVPYSQLDDETKEYDRKSVLKMMQIAAGRGKILVNRSNTDHNI